LVLVLTAHKDRSARTVNRFGLIVLVAFGLAGPALAKPLGQFPVGTSEIFVLAQSRDVAISPAEAADIAEQALPGFRALKVKLLPSGVYAVTLKADGEVQRVMVDAETGAVQ
jgi:uncharacterized membrane protein YkoI